MQYVMEKQIIELLNSQTINEQWVVKHMEGRGHAII